MDIHMTTSSWHSLAAVASSIAMTSLNRIVMIVFAPVIIRGSPSSGRIIATSDRVATVDSLDYYSGFSSRLRLAATGLIALVAL
jgi:hypothetical protein